MQPIHTPTENLKLIAQHYLADSAFLAADQREGAVRQANLPELGAMLEAFIAGDLSLPMLRQQLDQFLHDPAHSTWGATGFIMMTVNQLKNHYEQTATMHLRQTLNGINKTNIGSRFMGFANFMDTENKRLSLKEKGPAPGRSPQLIALFGHWLKPQEITLIPWPSLRKGLKVLHDHHALPLSTGLHFDQETGVRVATAADYEAVEEAITALEVAVPALAKTGVYWAEDFLAWVSQKARQISSWLGEETVEFPDEALMPIAPDALAERIAELRRELLVPAHVIERIYQALVLGHHVILSGPPGTGKTQLASKLPHTLWSTKISVGVNPTPFTPSGSHITEQPTTTTSYTVTIATATDEWTPRHIIGGIEPTLAQDDGSLGYEIGYGYLTKAIMANWALDPDEPASWTKPRRQRVSARLNDQSVEYRGLWLVIDEFNRAPIDLALGEALTALGGQQTMLTVPTRLGSRSLRMPRDFRIIGTLNTFDRHFLNQMSEALKRRFVFVEIMPPTREEREAEQGIVVKSALEALPDVDWNRLGQVVQVQPGDRAVPWRIVWQPGTALQAIFEEGWRLFEVIRVYRQFGTAQAIGWCTALLGAGLLKNLDPDAAAEWRMCLGAAFADTLADQLQILFPDELEVLLAYLKHTTPDGFSAAYHGILARQLSAKRRKSQLLALQSIKQADGSEYVDQPTADKLLNDAQPTVPAEALTALFHSDQPRERLPEFELRLERFLYERSI